MIWLSEVKVGKNGLGTWASEEKLVDAACKQMQEDRPRHTVLLKSLMFEVSIFVGAS